MALKLDGLKTVMNKERIDNGAWLHLLMITERPVDGADDGQTEAVIGNPLYLDPDRKTQPCKVLVRSVRSDAFRSKNFSLQQRALSRASRAKGHARDQVLDQEMRLERPRKFATLVAGFENASKAEPGFQKATEDDLLKIAEDSDMQWLVDQVMEFAFDDSNFGGDALGNEPAASPSSASSSSD